MQGLDTPLELTIASQYFYPEQNATSKLLTELAVELASRGVVTRAVTTAPTYRGLRAAPRREVHRGVEIIRVPSVPVSRSTRPGRAIQTMSFAASATARLLAEPQRGPVLLVTNPPQLFWTASLLRRLRGRASILLVYDLYPEIAEATGFMHPKGITARAWRRLNRRAFADADAVAVLGPAMAERITAGYGVPRHKVVEIPNWSDPNFITPLDKADNAFAREHGLADKFVVQMSGNLGLFQEIDSLLAAAELLRDAGVCFVFIGDGGQKHKIVDAAARLENVKVLDYLPEEQIPQSLTACDVSIISLRPQVEGLAVPSRTYASMAAGTPILAVMPRSADVASVVHTHDCGVVADYAPEDVARAILELKSQPERRRQMGRNGRSALVQEYTVQRAADRYVETLDRLRPPH